ncbi:hypothetical protein ACNI7D_00555 [Mycoplasmoides pneumoniae]
MKTFPSKLTERKTLMNSKNGLPNEQLTQSILHLQMFTTSLVVLNKQHAV